MYGLIAKLSAVPGKRDELQAILLESTGGMPGCLHYIIAKDIQDPDALWITEAWADEQSHRASLTLPTVQQAIAHARPLIAGFSNRIVTEPVGGHEAVSRWRVAPYFIVDDVVATANFYRDTLGFRYDRFWDEPPAFCMVYRRGVVIMLSQLEERGVLRPNSRAVSDGDLWDAYVWVDAVEPLYEEFKAKGVTIGREICDQPYGCRDFDVIDCNGYRLCFGQDMG